MLPTSLLALLSLLLISGCLAAESFYKILGGESPRATSTPYSDTPAPMSHGFDEWATLIMQWRGMLRREISRRRIE
jgi:hypothetical protein